MQNRYLLYDFLLFSGVPSTSTICSFVYFILSTWRYQNAFAACSKPEYNFNYYKDHKTPLNSYNWRVFTMLFLWLYYEDGRGDKSGKREKTMKKNTGSIMIFIRVEKFHRPITCGNGNIQSFHPFSCRCFFLSVYISLGILVASWKTNYMLKSSMCGIKKQRNTNFKLWRKIARLLYYIYYGYTSRCRLPNVLNRKRSKVSFIHSFHCHFHHTGSESTACIYFRWKL